MAWIIERKGMGGMGTARIGTERSGYWIGADGKVMYRIGVEWKGVAIGKQRKGKYWIGPDKAVDGKRAEGNGVEGNG